MTQALDTNAYNHTTSPCSVASSFKPHGKAKGKESSPAKGTIKFLLTTAFPTAVLSLISTPIGLVTTRILRNRDNSSLLKLAKENSLSFAFGIAALASLAYLGENVVPLEGQKALAEGYLMLNLFHLIYHTPEIVHNIVAMHSGKTTKQDIEQEKITEKEFKGAMKGIVPSFLKRKAR